MPSECLEVQLILQPTRVDLSKTDADSRVASNCLKPFVAVDRKIGLKTKTAASQRSFSATRMCTLSKKKQDAR